MSILPKDKISENKKMSKQPIESKVVILGATAVGKTCIICRAVNDEFDQDISPTVGACYSAKDIALDSANVTLQLWDTAGQERFRTLAPMYYRGSVIAVLVFSLTKPDTLQDVKSWAQEIQQQTDEMPVLFVVGNKLDLVDERQISTEQGEEVAKELNAIYFEVSAKSSIGIDDLFVRIAEESFKKLGSATQVETNKVQLEQTTTKKKDGKCC